jgi:hypothetical protein
MSYRSIISLMPKTSVDADAQAFLTAAAITDPTISSSINKLVVDLKSAGVWTKMKAIYPMVGGTASTHKFNLKDPRDLDAAFRLQFNGGWTHSANGAISNGTNGFANTYLNPSVDITSYQSNHHLSIYSRTKEPIGTGFAMGVGNTATGNPLYGLTLARQSETGAPTYYDVGNFSNNGRLSYLEFSVGNNARAFYLGSCNATNNQKLYKNNNIIATNTANVIGTVANAPIYIATFNPTSGSFFYQGINYALISIGDKLNDTEAANLYTAVQAFQTTLNRQV